MSAARLTEGSAEDVRCGRPRACGGKSHSCVTPTTSGPAPTAKSISVALGSKLTIFTVEFDDLEALRFQQHCDSAFQLFRAYASRLQPRAVQAVVDAHAIGTVCIPQTKSRRNCAILRIAG